MLGRFALGEGHCNTECPSKCGEFLGPSLANAHRQLGAAGAVTMTTGILDGITPFKCFEQELRCKRCRQKRPRAEEL